MKPPSRSTPRSNSHVLGTQHQLTSCLLPTAYGLPPAACSYYTMDKTHLILSPRAIVPTEKSRASCRSTRTKSSNFAPQIDFQQMLTKRTRLKTTRGFQPRPLAPHLSSLAPPHDTGKNPPTRL